VDVQGWSGMGDPRRGQKGRLRVGQATVTRKRAFLSFGATSAAFHSNLMARS
jgi:hypothetical protein